MALMHGVRFVRARWSPGAFGSGKPIGIVLHRTGRSNFEGMLESWRLGPKYDSGPKKGQDKKTSIHFLIGKQGGEIAQLMDTSHIAYHVGRANEHYVGIEFASISPPKGTPTRREDAIINADPLTSNQISGGRRVLKWLSQTHGIPLVGPPTAKEFKAANGLWNGVTSHAIVAESKLFGTDHGDELEFWDWYALEIWPKGMMR